MSSRTRILLAVGLIAAALFFLGLAIDHHGLRMAVKPIPVVAMGVFVRLRARDRYATLVLFGLVASLAGDVLLEASPDFFVQGLVAFLVGHLLYVSAYLARSRRLHAARALPWAVYGAAIYALVSPGLGSMAIPVAVYTAVICTMGYRAWATSDAWVPRGAALHALVGATLFVISDSLIALDKFHTPIEGVRYAILSLYWLGQLGIARSVAE